MADTDEEGTEPSRIEETPTLDRPTVLVGVGVGAASLPSMEQLFAATETRIGAAYLVAVRQQEGLDIGIIIGALRRLSPLAVTMAMDGDAIKPNWIYVGGPDDMIAISATGHLRIRPAAEPVGHRGTIDSMIISLAEHAHDRAVAVILAGLGHDGTAGITATKKFGGLSITEQIPGTHEDAPGATGPAPVADLHLPVDMVASAIARYAGSLAPLAERDTQEVIAAEIEAQATQITTILRNVTGHDFHGYKRGTFIRRVQRRIQVMQVADVNAYLARLRSDRDEVRNLFQDLLIGVTQFFRDPAEFEVLEHELPRLFAGKSTGDQLRVWVLGCATGEEAYSIAILLREWMAALDDPPEAQIFATDLDARALSLARAGRYARESIVNHIRPDRVERWFVREGDTFCVSKELREMCIFSPHNIVKDAPFSRIDILSCRNLLIYLNPDLQNRVIPIFHFSLRTGGVLFLGSSENVTRHPKLFAAVDRRNRVFRRLETATRIIPDFPFTARSRSPQPHDPDTAPAVPSGRLTASISRRAEAIVERYAPAYVVVDAQGDVLHFSGRTGRYLEPAAGAATLNLLNLVNRDLRLDLRSALARAVAELRPIELPRLQLTREDRTYAVNVMVEPLGTSDVISLVVVFQDAGIVPEGTVASDRLSGDEQVQRLEAELRATRDRLQAAIEELESTNEELKSSNEEYQSINEELQSASEEMETSKEELQSVNEELHTVNGELAHRVTELAATNSDIKNLLESTQIATVFLDSDLRIRNFTPAVTDIFHLLDTDIGRPLHHVVSRVRYPELTDDVRRVLKTLAPVERSVADPAADRHYAARVLPYRSVDNYIGGTVVTFTDMTEVRRVEAALRESESRYRDDLERQVLERTAELKQSRDLVQATMDASMDMIQVFEAVRDDRGEIVDFRWLLTNQTSETKFGKVVGRSLLERNPGVMQEGIFAAFKEVVETGGARRDERHYVHEQLDGWFYQSVVKLGDGVATTIMEITERKKAEAEILRLRDEVAQASLRESEKRYRILFEAIDEGFCTIEVLFDAEDKPVDYRFLQVNPAFELQSGLTDVVDRTVRDLVPERESRWFEIYGHIAVTGEPVRFEGAAAALGRWYDVYAFRVDEPEERHVAVLFRNVTDRKRAEMALRESETRARRLVEGISQATWEADAEGLMRVDSPSWRAYTGQSFEEWIGYGWVDAIHPEDRAYTEHHWRDAIAAERDVNAEFRLRHAASDGWRWTNVRAVPLLSDDGRIQKWVGMNIDIDERKRAGETIRVSEERFRALVSAGASMIYRMSPDWRLMYQLSGRNILADAIEPLENWVDAYILFEDRPMVAAAVEEAIRTRSLFDLEHRVRRIDGSIGWVLSRAVPILGLNGEVEEWVGAGVDIEARKRAEAALREVEQRQTFLLELSDALRPLADPIEIQSRAMQVLGRHLGATRAQYYEADESGNYLDSLDGYSAGASAGTGRVRVDDLGSHVAEGLRAGRIVTSTDVTIDPRLGEEERIVHENMGFFAYVAIPLVKEGRLVAVLGVHQGEARDWTTAEIALIEETAERTWAAVERARAETALAGSEQRFRSIVEAVEDVFYMTALDQRRLLYLSPAYERVWQRPASEILEDLSRFTKSIHPDDRAIVAANIERQERGEAIVSEYRIVRPDGSVRWIADRSFPVAGARQRLSAGLARDVTGSKQSETTLRETEERLRRFGEASQDVLWIRDVETFQWEYLTPAFETIYGLDRASALRGDNMARWVDLIVPEDRERAANNIQRVRDGESVTFEYRVQRPVDGAIRWLRNTDFPIRDEAGRVAHIGGIGHDITELKGTEVALAEAERRQRALVEGIPQLVWRAVHGGEWTWASPQWTAYTGQTEAESRGRGWLSTLHPDDRAIADDAWATAVETGGFQVEYRIRQAAPAGYRWFQTRAAALRDESGNVTEWLGTSTDVDELRRLQERQKVLVAELQHRTRNLMGVVRSMSDTTLRSSIGLDDFASKFTDRLIALARVQGLLARLNPNDRVTFDELVRAELSATGALSDLPSRITLEGPQGIALRSSTVQTFALALHELATNAVKYGALKQPTGRLVVRWRLERPEADQPPWLHVDWHESGVTVPPDSAPSLGGGAGRTLIERALPYQLGAKTTFVLAPDGVRCTIGLPVSTLTPIGDLGHDE